MKRNCATPQRLAALPGLALLLLLLLVSSFSACARDKYWIPGLSLPPGAVVVDATETKSRQQTTGAAPAKSIQRLLQVSFNCPGGWEAVLTHIEPRLTRAGYSNAGASFGAPEPTPAGRDWASLVRLYEKPGSSYSVMLQNMDSLLGQYAKQGGPPSGNASLGLGEYTLYIYEK